MDKYENNKKAVQGLVLDKSVHRDVYVNEEVFKLEMEHLFPNVWVLLGMLARLRILGILLQAKLATNLF